MKEIDKLHIAIVGSTFHKEITEQLEKHCIATLTKNGVPFKSITVVHVPGSLEIPLAAKKLAKKGVFDAIIVLGIIHKGETYHFELVARECARGCMDVSLTYEIPVIFEVLAVYDIKDALKRATGKEINRGIEAALTALSIIKTLDALDAI